jgi:predicted Rdx family selenoprotein
MTRTFLMVVFIVAAGTHLSAPALALPSEVKADLERYAAFWKKKADAADTRLKKEFPDGIPQRSDANYAKYVALARARFDGNQKSKTYLEASKTEDGMLSIIKETAAGTMSDMLEMGEMMLGRELLKNIWDRSWTDILKSAYDAMFRMKIRKLIREKMACPKPVKELEDHCMEMVNPTVEKSRVWEQFEKGADKGVDKLKKKYEKEIKKQFTKKWLKKTKGMAKDTVKKMADKFGKKAMEQATGAIDAAKFTIDVAQKVFFWNEYAPTISQTVDAVALRRQKYAEQNQDISCTDAYLVWAKKKTIALNNTDTAKGTDSSLQKPDGGSVPSTRDTDISKSDTGSPRVTRRDTTGKSVPGNTDGPEDDTKSSPSANDSNYCPVSDELVKRKKKYEESLAWYKNEPEGEGRDKMYRWLQVNYRIYMNEIIKYRQQCTKPIRGDLLMVESP